jgi:hypothetical protein
VFVWRIVEYLTSRYQDMHDVLMCT